ncbi:MAG: N-acetyltransferase [Bryobacterales bacterium]|nr:N-acetyltransferase [Bryobacterales bacterium]
MADGIDARKPSNLSVRKALMPDIPPLVKLINSFAARGIMLPRTEFELAENVRDFTVVADGDRLIACGALHFYTARAAEIRSLAVDSEYQKHGVGAVLMQALEKEARTFDLEGLFAFTYVPGFFRKQGYREVDRAELPLKAWKDCLRCPKFQACDEIAMWKALREGGAGFAGQVLAAGNPSSRDPGLVPLLPLVR